MGSLAAHGGVGRGDVGEELGVGEHRVEAVELGLGDGTSGDHGGEGAGAGDPQRVPRFGQSAHEEGTVGVGVEVAESKGGEGGYELPPPPLVGAWGA